MYHQNLGSRRFTHLTRELLYETPRGFSFGPVPYKPQAPATKPSFYAVPGSSVSSSSSSNSSPHGSFRRKSSRSKIANAAREGMYIPHQQQLGDFEDGRKRTKAQRISQGSQTTTLNSDMSGAAAVVVVVEEESSRRGSNAATLNIVLGEYDEKTSRESGIGYYDEPEEVEEIVPNIPYKSPSHPDVVSRYTNSQSAIDVLEPSHSQLQNSADEKALTKPKWRKQPLAKIQRGADKLKEKVNWTERKASITQKIPFLRHGSTMDRIRETFRVARCT